MDNETIANPRIEIGQLPARHTAAAYHIGPYYTIGEAFGRVESWARRNGLVTPGQDTPFLATFIDDLELVEESKLRSAVCIEVPTGTTLSDGIEPLDFAGGRFAVGHFELAVGEFPLAWDATFGWILKQGLEVDMERNNYELYLKDNSEHPQKRYTVDICLPIKG